MLSFCTIYTVNIGPVEVRPSFVLQGHLRGTRVRVQRKKNKSLDLHLWPIYTNKVFSDIENIPNNVIMLQIYIYMIWNISRDSKSTNTIGI